MLPVNIIQLCELFKKTQQGNFSVSFMNSKATSGFNVASNLSTATSSPILSRSSVEGNTVRQLKESSVSNDHLIYAYFVKVLGKQFVKKLTCTNGKFNITS
jgi:hypothetical protein